MVQCDVEWHDGTPVAPSPRQVLRAQVEKAHELGLEPMFGSELEFFLFRETYLEAHAKHYHDLTPSVPYILDYHILAASFDEPFLRSADVMKAAGWSSSRRRRAWAGNTTSPGTPTADDPSSTRPIGDRAPARCSVTFAETAHDWVAPRPHPLLALARRRERVRRRVGPLPALPRRADRMPGRPRDLRRAGRELVQALRGGELGAHHARVGVRQPDVRLPRRRPRLRVPARDPHSRRRCEPYTRVRALASQAVRIRRSSGSLRRSRNA